MPNLQKEFIMVTIDRETTSIIVDCYAYTHIERFGGDSDGSRGWPTLRVIDVVFDGAVDSETFEPVTLTSAEKDEASTLAANKVLGR